MSVKIEAFVVKDTSTFPNVHVGRVIKDFLCLSGVWSSDASREDDIHYQLLRCGLALIVAYFLCMIIFSKAYDNP